MGYIVYIIIVVLTFFLTISILEIKDRSAKWFVIGLCALGILISLIYLIHHYAMPVIRCLELAPEFFKRAIGATRERLGLR